MCSCSRYSTSRPTRMVADHIVLLGDARGNRPPPHPRREHRKSTRRRGRSRTGPQRLGHTHPTSCPNTESERTGKRNDLAYLLTVARSRNPAGLAILPRYHQRPSVPVRMNAPRVPDEPLARSRMCTISELHLSLPPETGLPPRRLTAAHTRRADPPKLRCSIPTTMAPTRTIDRQSCDP